MRGIVAACPYCGKQPLPRFNILGEKAPEYLCQNPKCGKKFTILYEDEGQQALDDGEQEALEYKRT